MSDESEKAANEAKLAAEEGKSALKHAADAATDEVRDNVHKLEGTAHDAAQAVKKVDPWLLSRISGDMGIGFFALSVSFYSGAIAYSKFRNAFRK